MLNGAFRAWQELSVWPEVLAEMPSVNELLNLSFQFTALFGVVSVLPMETVIF